MREEWKTIFLVDDNASNLLVGRNSLSTVYNVYTCISGALMFRVLEKIRPDLILLDIEMPEMDGYEVMQRLKDNMDTASIPVVFLTEHNSEETKTKGLSLGAIDYITKPFSDSFLLERIGTHLESPRSGMRSH